VPGNLLKQIPLDYLDSDFTMNYENWKYTKFKAFNSLTFDFIPTRKQVEIKCNPYEIIIYNGRIVKLGSAIKENIYIENISTAVKNNTYNCKKYFNKILPYNKNLFTAYNPANLKLGIFIYVKENTILTESITIKHIIDQGSKKSFMNFRTLISIQENSEVNIIFNDLFKTEHSINTIYEVQLNNNSKLELTYFSKKHLTQEMQNFAANINRNSILKMNCINLSGKLLKNNYYINLIAKNSECLLNGLCIINKNNHVDSFIEIVHNNKYSMSNLNYKIIAHDNSCGILYAKSIINKSSSNCEAHQKNNNLILSDKAKIHANPQLEIYNDEVQCSHSSSTGAMEKENIYYMRTRGINEEDAKILLLNGFINSITNKISDIKSKNNINRKINNYIQNVNSF